MMVTEPSAGLARDDCARWTDAELVACMVGAESSLREVIIAIIDRPSCSQEEVYNHAAILGYSLTVDILARLRRAGAGPSALMFLIWLRSQVERLYVEMRVRLAPRPVGRALLSARRVGAGEGALRGLMVSLKVERITSIRPEKESDEDLRQEALANAMKYLEQAERKTAALVALPDRVKLPAPPNVRLPSVDVSRWDFERLRARHVGKALKLFLPALRGETEDLPQRVRQALRDHFETWEAQKRAGTEEDLNEEAVVAADEAQPESVVDDRTIARNLYYAATQRWGEPGRRFLEGMLAGKTVTDASKEAGVTRKTGHQYLRELRKTFSQREH